MSSKRSKLGVAGFVVVGFVVGVGAAAGAEMVAPTGSRVGGAPESVVA